MGAFLGLVGLVLIIVGGIKLVKNRKKDDNNKKVIKKYLSQV